MPKIMLYVDTRKLGGVGHPFMKKVKSLEIWQDGHFLETIKVEDEKVMFERRGKIKEIRIIE